MEYDPAFPTDEPEDKSLSVDLSSIPLPSTFDLFKESGSTAKVHDIPLPHIPMPPVLAGNSDAKLSQVVTNNSSEDVIKSDISDVSVGPLKFSLKLSSKPHSGSEVPSESSGIFESSKDNKPDEPRAMPKLQAMMKRSKPSQLPVGVLPSKSKVPASETKSELFLPSKELDNFNLTYEQLKSIYSLTAPSAYSSNLSTKPADTNEMLSNAIKEINALNNFAQMASTGGLQTSTIPQSMKPSRTKHPHLPKLKDNMQTPPIPPPSMQYVNPQKFRSAQMIATPLIANPAVAAQSRQTDDQLKSKESRKRSRSRSRRHSRSRKRSRSRRRSDGRYRSRHHRSSSSSGSPKRRSNHKESRSRKSSGDRHRSSHPERNHSRSRDKRPRDQDRPPKSAREEEVKSVDSDQKHIKSRARSSSGESVDVIDKKRSRNCSEVVNAAEFESEDKCDSHQKSGNISKESHRHRNYRGVDKRDNGTVQESSHSVASPKSKKVSSNDDPAEHSAPVNNSKSKKDTNLDKESRKIKPKSYQRSSSEVTSDTDSVTSGSSDSSTKKAPKSAPSIKKSKVQSKRRSPSSSDSSSSSSSNSPCNNHVSKLDKILKSESNKTVKNLDDVASETLPTQKTVNIDVIPLGLLEISPSTVTSHPLDSEMEPESDIDLDSNCLDNLEIEDETRSYEGDLLDTASDLGATSSPDNYCPTPVPNVKAFLQTAQQNENKHEKAKVESTDPRSNARQIQISTNGSKYDLRKRKTKRQMICPLPSPVKLQTEFTDCSIELSDVFASYPDVPTPKYIHILQNDYSFMEANPQHTVNIKQNSGSARLVGTSESRTDIMHYEMRQWICDCTIPEDAGLGIFACGPGCINRALNIECGQLCPARDFCSNRQFQLRLYAPSEPFYAGKHKGWGLRATSLIEKDSFVIEYTGEVIDFNEFRRRIRRYERLCHAHHYFMALEPDRFIDAGNKGNWARFVNHSCEPNCVTQKWSVDGRIRIGFFAIEDIPCGEEITIDYQFVQYGALEQKCYCGTPTCSGVMGATSKHLQEKVRLKDTTVVERRVLQLLELNSFQHAEDITLLLQVMVQECLTRYARMQLLQRLAATESDACLKLFRQYNGLDMLAAFMCDTLPHDWELKKLILICLDRIPVSEQNQVQSNSRLIDIVAQWTVNPEHCRPRQQQTEREQNPNDTACLDSDLATTKPTTTKTATDSETDTVLDSTNQTAHMLVDSASEKITPGGLMEESKTEESLEEDVLHNAVFAPDLPPDSNSISSVAKSTATYALITDKFSVVIDRLDDSKQSLNRTPDPDSSPNVLIDSETGELEITESSVSVNNPPPPPPPSSTSSRSLPLSDSKTEEDLEWIEEIKKLATDLYEKWLKLPKENYRIPRLERQETEKMLHISYPVASTLVSWGTEHEEKSDLKLKTWTQSVTTKSNRNKLYKTKRDPSDKYENKTPKSADQSSGLAKAERRMLFEAQVRAEEEKVASEAKAVDNITESQPLNEVVDKNHSNTIEQLLLYALLSECGQNKSAITSLLSNSEKELEHMPVVAALLKALPTIIDNDEKAKDPGLVASLCEELKRYAADKSLDELPTGWQSTTDTNGRVYYYNVHTKAVQWEKPVLNTESSDENNLPTEDYELMKKQFTKEVGNYVLHLLKPYRLPNCLTGRIESNDDLVHLTKKFTFMFVSKVTKNNSDNDKRLCTPLTKSMQGRVRSTVTRYMTSRGPVYKRRSKTSSNNTTTTTSRPNTHCD